MPLDSNYRAKGKTNSTQTKTKISLSIINHFQLMNRESCHRQSNPLRKLTHKKHIILITITYLMALIQFHNQTIHICPDQLSHNQLIRVEMNLSK